jgi:lipopolysaccharide transport system ATP-binding protein
VSEAVDVAISVRNLSKFYPQARSSIDPLRYVLRALRGAPASGQAAISDVSFEVAAGKALGIVGRNGSGKSTLLRILAGSLRQSSGEARVRGRRGALLDLSAGINPDFTGRENARLLSILSGAGQRESEARLPAMRDFSGLGDAFESPVKTYSSGMILRLAFSAAIHGDPEVMLVDEALAVGDAFFQQRCLRRIREFRASGGTIVLVSHDPSAILSLCDEAIWLEHGQIAQQGHPDEVIRHYLAARYRDDCSLDSEVSAPEMPFDLATEAAVERADKLPPGDGAFGDGRAAIVGVAMRDGRGHQIGTADDAKKLRNRCQCVRLGNGHCGAYPDKHPQKDDAFSTSSSNEIEKA